MDGDKTQELKKEIETLATLQNEDALVQIWDLYNDANNVNKLLIAQSLATIDTDFSAHAMSNIIGAESVHDDYIVKEVFKMFGAMETNNAADKLKEFYDFAIDFCKELITPGDILPSLQEIGTNRAAEITTEVALSKTGWQITALVSLIEFPKADEIYYTREINKAAQKLAFSLLNPYHLLEILAESTKEEEREMSAQLELVDNSGILGNHKLQDLFDHARALPHSARTPEAIDNITSDVHKRLSFAAFSI